MNHYEMLGVARDATSEEIRKAYRHAAKALHPDRFASASESPWVTADRSRRFSEVRAAYETLSDRRRRYEYDKAIQVPQGLGDLLASPHGQRAMARLLPRAPKQARDGDDIVTVVRVPPSTFAAGGASDAPPGIPNEFDPLFLPANVRKTPWARLPERGEKGENDGSDGDLFVLVVPETP